MHLTSALALLLSMPAAAPAAQEAGRPAAVTYEQFAALTPEERHDRFRGLEDANKAVLLRQHVETWLQKHRWRLSRAQVAIVEELGALLFERYDDPPASRTPEFEARVEALGLQALYNGKARCRLRQSDLWAVLGPTVRPLPPTWGWRDDMWAWLVDCVAPAVLR